MKIYFELAIIIGLLVAFALIIISFLIKKERHSRIVRRLEEIKRPRQEAISLKLEGDESGLFANILISCGRLISPKSGLLNKGTEKRLHGAGIYSVKGKLMFQGFKVLIPAGLLLVFLFSLPVLIYHPFLLIAMAFSCLLLGAYAPLVVLHYLTKNRKVKLVKGFPDALDLLAICAEAGVGFDTAIKRVAEEIAFSHKHISNELMSYIYETQIGVPRHEALRNFAERTDVDIIRSFITLLIQSDKLGTSIATTLKVYSDSLRTKRRQDAEIKAARLPVLMLFPLLFFIFPSLYVVILGPATINIFKTFIAK